MYRLTYIWHDCFVYSDEAATIIFDFWKDPIAKRGELPLFLTDIPCDKPLYVFVSHHHKDHYSKYIWEWARRFPNIRYIISKDLVKFARHIIRPDSIYTGFKPNPESVITLKPGETWTDDTISVRAFGSTDIGNSYSVATKERCLFHAGDLNAWIWKDESTEEEVNREMKSFNEILDEIANYCPKIDVGMFPVDSRIGTDYFAGAAAFVRKINVAHFFPMHFGLGETSEEQMRYQLDASKFERYANPSRGEYISLQAPYSSFMHTEQ